MVETTIYHEHKEEIQVTLHKSMGLLTNSIINSYRYNNNNDNNNNNNLKVGILKY